MLKKLPLLLCLAFNALLWAALEPPFLGDARPPRQIKIGTAPTVTLQPGRPGQVEVVVHPEAGPVTRYAARELAEYLSRILEQEVPLQSSPADGVTSLLVGISPYSRQAGIDDSRLCRDAFIIKSIGQDIYLLGRDDSKADPASNARRKGGIWAQYYERGSMFAVYDFLERFGQVRFYFPHEMGVLVPQAPIALPEIDIYDRPDWESRMISQYCGQGLEEEPQAELFAVTLTPCKNRWGAYLRLQTKYVNNCHGLALLGYAERFGESHPEYFALRSDGRRYCDPAMQHTGQLCYNSNIMEEIYQDARAFLTGQSAASRGVITRWGVVWDPTGHQPGIFGMMPQDGFNPCLCEKCRPIKEAGQQALSNFIWSKVVWLCQRLAADGIDGYVSNMAYYPYNLVPEVEIPENVLVMVAVRGAWMLSNPVGWKRDLQLVRDWNAKLGRRTWLWNYSGKFGSLGMPTIPSWTPQAVGKFYLEIGPEVHGAFMESECDKQIYHAMNYYVFGKVGWDNRTDVTALLQEFYQRMFGPAAATMQGIFQRYEELWLEKVGGRCIDTPLGPTSAPPSAAELWSDIYSAAELERQAAAYALAEEQSAGAPEYQSRVRYMRQQFLEPTLAAAAEYRSLNDAISSFRVAIPILAASPALELDGQATEEFWSAASELHLQALKNHPVDAPRLRSTVRLAQDAEHIYMFYHCAEPELAGMVATQREFDDQEIWIDNGLEIFINPSGDRKHYFQFIINSLGCVSDASRTCLGKKTIGDWSWNGNLRVKIAIVDGAWQAEIVLPKAGLGAFAEGGWVANFCRNRVVGGSELYSWSPFLEGGFHELENFGTILNALPEERSLVQDGTFAVEPQGHNVFGKWISDYRTRPGTHISLDRSTFVFADRSLRLEAEQGCLFGAAQYLPALKPSTKYRLSFYIKYQDVVPTAKGGGANMNIWSDRNLWFPQNFYVGTRDWFRQSFEFTTGPETNRGKNKSYIKPYLLNATGTVWFDGITLQEIPEP
jgi:hypothetical protein